MLELGKIENVNVKDIWQNETFDFTPWLAENLDQLGEVLNLDLELDSTEVPVGNYRLDVLARDAINDAVVAIENQIADTDHRHLGQLLTYAAGTEASIVIWVATKFQEEHRAALDWLNQGTKDSIDFFGVEIGAAKIGDSLPAPLFRLAAVPNFWSERAKPGPTTGLTETQQRYLHFWKPLLEELNREHGWSIRTENPRSYYGAGSGFGQIGRTMRFTWEKEARVELSIQSTNTNWNKAVFDLLKDSREQIESDLGTELVWERLDDSKSSRIGVSRSGSLDDSEEELDEIRSWMIDHVQKFRPVFRPYLEDVLSRMEVDT